MTERNCQKHIKVEDKGSIIIHWRCLNDATITITKMDGCKLRVCEEHSKFCSS